MKIEHIAIWSLDLKRLRDFYVKYFEAVSNEIYENEITGFKSYFLVFKEGSRLEIMYKDDILAHEQSDHPYRGYAHLAISVGTKNEVIRLTNLLREDGYNIIGEPRTTGDGYFESVVSDPDGNQIEISS